MNFINAYKYEALLKSIYNFFVNGYILHILTYKVVHYYY